MDKKIFRLTASFAAICGVLAASQTCSQAWAQTAKGLSIEVLSSRSELVSGGDGEALRGPTFLPGADGGFSAARGRSCRRGSTKEIR